MIFVLVPFRYELSQSKQHLTSIVFLSAYTVKFILALLLYQRPDTKVNLHQKETFNGVKKHPFNVSNTLAAKTGAPVCSPSRTESQTIRKTWN